MQDEEITEQKQNASAGRKVCLPGETLYKSNEVKQAERITNKSFLSPGRETQFSSLGREPRFPTDMFPVSPAAFIMSCLSLPSRGGKESWS